MSNCFRLMTDNFVDEDILANADVSSEQAAFPVENAFNKNRRSKVWRSEGYWQIIDGQNTIAFKEDTAGSTLTATVAVAEYTNTATFLQAVQDSLNAAGVSNYIVTQNATTLRINILSDGVGDAGDCDLLFSISTDMADILGYNQIDRTGSLTYDADQFKIHTSEWILWDLGISSNPTSFIFVDDRNESIPISPDAVIRLQGNETDNWTTPSFTQDIPYDDEVISVISSTGLATEAYRYWRILFIDDNPNGYIQVGAFFLGNHMWFDLSKVRGAGSFPLSLQKIDRSRVVTSEGGQEFTDDLPKTESFSITFTNLTVEEKEILEEKWELLGRDIPFFISMDSDEVFSSVFNRSMKYVKFLTAPNVQLTRPKIYNVTLTFKEQL